MGTIRPWRQASTRFGDDAFSMHCYGNHPLFLEGSEIGRGCVARQKRARDYQKISTLLIRDVASWRQMRHGGCAWLELEHAPASLGDKFGGFLDINK